MSITSVTDLDSELGEFGLQDRLVFGVRHFLFHFSLILLLLFLGRFLSGGYFGVAVVGYVALLNVS